MIFKALKKSDIPDIVEVMPAFIAETYPKEKWNLESFENAILPFTNSVDKKGIVVRDEKGKLISYMCYFLIVDVFNGERLTLIENMMYIRPENRGGPLFSQLLENFEEIAKRVNAWRTIITIPYPEEFERIKKIYERKGYMPFEISFVKELK